MMKGGSRIWRRTGEREVTSSQNQTDLITAKGGTRQKISVQIPRFQIGLVCYS